MIFHISYDDALATWTKGLVEVSHATCNERFARHLSPTIYRSPAKTYASASSGLGMPRRAKPIIPSGPIRYTVRFTIGPLAW